MPALHRVRRRRGVTRWSVRRCGPRHGMRRRGRCCGRRRSRMRWNVWEEHPWWGLFLGPCLIGCTHTRRLDRFSASLAWAIQSFDPRRSGQLAQLLHRHHLGGLAVLLRGTTPGFGHVAGAQRLCVRILSRKAPITAGRSTVLTGGSILPASISSRRSGTRLIDEDLRRERRVFGRVGLSARRWVLRRRWNRHSDDILRRRTSEDSQPVSQP